MDTSKGTDSSTSGTTSRKKAETLDLDKLPSATAEVAEALERNRPGPMTYEEYFRWLAQFHWTKEQLEAIPLNKGPRFTLD